MRGKDNVTRFLNVDIDFRGDTGDLEDFLRPIETSVVVLNQTQREASVELAKEFLSLEETIVNLAEFVRPLPPEAKNIWNRFEFRKVN